MQLVLYNSWKKFLDLYRSETIGDGGTTLETSWFETTNSSGGCDKGLIPNIELWKGSCIFFQIGTFMNVVGTI